MKAIAVLFSSMTVLGCSTILPTADIDYSAVDAKYDIDCIKNEQRKTSIDRVVHRFIQNEISQNEFMKSIVVICPHEPEFALWLVDNMDKVMNE
ncbi:hypothetical protein HWQ46_04695 [Shewanella sp. D64]|uniref:hypothetical protein n=1 Tax=unclassified Shewanella TaxID=196818 RepID=UPI0022BA2B65|nr:MULTISPECIES: hypothetical protein [unclassified Shewanella]MEC4724847.1 hypothetical protein [Shewanella sp. D64]MEC4736359.1 hypothetical protein [Shewanella sp. E94]WBJ97581.1 hypothetical protein HWQ47_11070 [Shewanella sp. MTB7]